MKGELCIKSGYSFLSSTLKVEDIIEVAKNNKYEYLCIMDKDVMYGALEFYNACVNNNIKPLIGVEFDINNDTTLCLIAKNKNGYLGLCKMSSLVNVDKEKITIELLKEYKEDLLVIMPSYRGLKKLNKEDFVTVLDYYKETFPHFYLGIEYYNNSSLFKINSYLRELDYKKVYFNNIVSRNKEDLDNIDVLKAIKNNEVIGYSRNKEDLEYSYFFSDDEKRNNFTYEELDCCNELVNLVDLRFEKESLKISKFNEDINFDSKAFLTKLAYKGLEKRNKAFAKDEKYISRLEKELKVINEMGFSDYFLIVYDYVKFAKNHGILVGPGRGSAAGSLVSYVLGITNVDPIKYDLLFERFLNVERISMPDIDIDFQDNRRDEVVNYLKDKYGSDRVANIVTFSTLAARQVLRDCARVMGLSKQDIELLSKKAHRSGHTSLEKMMELSKEFREFILSDEKYQDVFDIAKSLEGLPRQTSIHAAGVVIANDRLDNILPVIGDKQNKIVQYDMNYLENLGLLKMDLLGIRNLTIIDDCIKEIKNVYDITIDLNSIDYNDPKIYKLISEGKTSGLFQLESEGMKKTIKIVNPKNFDDVASIIALYRPGPRDFIEEFTLRKDGKIKVEYPDECLKDILKPTYGIIVYQEQILQVATTFAGFSLSKADILRRAMSKKEENKMLALKEEFINGSISKGHKIEKAEEVFALILKFASYGFNKAHTVSYALIAIQMAYLKLYYSSIFFACVMESFAFGEKFSEYIAEAKENGITLKLPDVNHSDYGFKAINQNEISYGLSHIKGISSQFVRYIIEETKVNVFKDYIDFVVRMSKYKLNENQVYLLIDAGALDSFGYNRATLKHNYLKVLKYAEMIAINDGTQLSFDFDLVEKPVIKVVEESKEKLSLENDALGYYISEFPLEKIRKYLNKDNYISGQDFNKCNNKNIKTVLMIKKNKIIKTKKNELMSITTMMDEYDSIGVVIFPSLYRKISNLLNAGSYVVVEGKVEIKENISLIADNVKEFRVKENNG